MIANIGFRIEEWIKFIGGDDLMRIRYDLR
jgi:hypothetical protein